jgi:peptidoglycan hydrolase-like protein with peptidoglycan-binding domain
VALTALGFDTRGSDGVFGSRSREMIAAWQQKAGAPATGFLDAGQRDALLSAAAAAVARFDDDARKKAGDDKRMAAEAAAPRAAPAAAASASTPAADGLWRGTYSCGVGAAVGFQAPHISPPFTIDLEMRLANGSGSSKDYLPVHLQGDTRKIVVVVDSSGSVETTVFRAKSSTKLTGRFEGNVIRASGRETVVDRECTLAMTREASPAEQAAATSALAKFNGAYSSYTGSSGAAITNSGSVKFALTLDNGRGTVTLNKAGCAPQVFAVDLSATGQVSGKGTLTCVFQQGQDIIVGPATITGHPSGERQFALELATNRGTIRAQLRAGN